MTVARTSQVVVEVLRVNTAVRTQVSQAVVEVLRLQTTPPPGQHRMLALF